MGRMRAFRADRPVDGSSDSPESLTGGPQKPEDPDPGHGAAESNNRREVVANQVRAAGQHLADGFADAGLNFRRLEKVPGQ